MAHVATLLDDAAYHADCRPNRLAAEAAQARVLELEVQVAALTAMAAAVYQAAGAYDLPTRFLDALSAAAAGRDFDVEGLLPVDPADTPAPSATRDARVDASVAYAAGASAGREFGRGEGAPPSLVALHAKWCATKMALNASLSRAYGGPDEVVAFAAYASASNDLFAWTPEEAP